MTHGQSACNAGRRTSAGCLVQANAKTFSRRALCVGGQIVKMIVELNEGRFAHLLQPIRELAKNWDIDVASHLNDYLEELDEMCITFDDGRTRLNFAEAALLIQGTACIYSKKVELLHSLVYQTLEYINDKNKKKNPQAAKSTDGNACDEEHEHAEDASQFTDLGITPSNNTQSGESINSVNNVPLPPECLVPLDTRAKQKLPLISLKGEILCSQKDFRLVTLNPENYAIQLAPASTESRELIEAHQHMANLSEGQLLQNDEASVGEIAHTADVYVDVADNFLPLDANDMEVDREGEEHIERQQAPSEGRMIRERCQVEAFAAGSEAVPPAVNVWAQHDPYAVFGEDKPFKSGKCYKVPDGLDDGRKRKRKPSSSIQDFQSWFSGHFDPPTHKLKNGPHFMDLNDMYFLIVKEKMKTKKKIYRKAGVMISDEELRQTLLQPEEAERPGEGQEDGLCPLGNLDEDNDNSDNEHDGFPDDIPVEFGGAPDFLSQENSKDELSYEQLVKLRIEQLMVNSKGYTQETALSRRVKDWEDKIKPLLESQEERPAFDIHDYGDRIVNAYDGVGLKRSFASIVSGLDNFEACKYMLASLQLANDYTIEIDSLVGLEESVDSMSMTLLSAHRANDRFKALQAAKCK